MLQRVLDSIDGWITKSRSPLMNTLIASPLYLVVSLPLAIIVATLVIIAVGTLDTVGAGETLPGIIAGVVTILLFWLWAAYGTYSSSKRLQTE